MSARSGHACEADTRPCLLTDDSLSLRATRCFAGVRAPGLANNAFASIAQIGMTYPVDDPSGPIASHGGIVPPSATDSTLTFDRPHPTGRPSRRGACLPAQFPRLQRWSESPARCTIHPHPKSESSTGYVREYLQASSHQKVDSSVESGARAGRRHLQHLCGQSRPKATLLVNVPLLSPALSEESNPARW